MQQSELGGVQHRPWLVSLTVEPVADDWMPDRCQMHSDLMGPAGLQIDGNERPVRRRAQRPDRRDRPLPVIADAEGNRTDAPERRVDRLRFRELPLAERQIAFSNPLRLELPRQPGIDVRTLGEKNHSARSSIEPLQKEQCAGVCLRQLEQHRLVGIVAALDDDVRGLVDEEELFVLVEDVELHAQCGSVARYSRNSSRWLAKSRSGSSHSATQSSTLPPRSTR